MNKPLVFSLWLTLVLSAAWYALADLKVVTDMSAFMPRSGDNQAVLADVLREGPGSRVILLGVEGGPERRLAQASRSLARALSGTGRFSRVLNGESTLSKEEIARWFRYRYLLAPGIGPQTFSMEALDAAFAQRLRELASPVAMFEKERLPADPTATFRRVLETWKAEAGPRLRDGVWFSPDRARALLLLETKAPGFDLDQQDKNLGILEQTFDSLPDTQGLRLISSGPPIFAAHSRTAVRSQAQSLSVIATVAVIGILFAAYRSLPLLLLGALPLATAIAAAAATVGLVFGEIHGITLAFGITLLGVAVDYPIHLFSHLRAGEAPGLSLRRIWPALRLGVLTTAVAYGAMASTDFNGLSQLGVFAMAGLLAAAAFTRWVLPDLIPTQSTARVDRGDGRWIRRMWAPSAWTHAAGIGVGLAALAYLAVPFEQSPWEEDLAALSPVPAHLLLTDKALRRELAAPDVNQVIVIDAPDAESALQSSERTEVRLQALVKEGLIRGYDAPSRYLPSVLTQQERLAALPDAVTLRSNLDLALRGKPFKEAAFDPFVASVASSKTLAPLRPRDIEGTVLGARAQALLYQTARGWKALVPLTGVKDGAPIAERLEPLPAGAQYVHLKEATGRAVAEFRDEALGKVAWGSLLIAAILLFALRSVRRAVSVVLPVALALGVTVAVLLAVGAKLSLFHLVSLLLVLGIGIDYSLFFNQDGRDRAMRRQTLHGIAVCAISTTAVFGILATSTLPVLRAIGATAAVGVAASFLMALALAPIEELPDNTRPTQ